MGDDVTKPKDVKTDVMEFTARVTKLNEEFNDKRTIVALDIPDGEDIPVRDMHSKGEGYGKIIGWTHKDKIRFDDDGVMEADWTLHDAKLIRTVKAAKYPKKVFEGYSPELGNPVRVGYKRAGVLKGIATLPAPAWEGSETKEIRFEELIDSDEFFGTQTEVHKEEIIVTGKKEEEIFETQLKLKEKEHGMEIEQFESQIETLKIEKVEIEENFESKVKEITEDFESQLATLKTEKEEVTENFETLKTDFEAVKSDKETLAKKVEEFESSEKTKLAEEVFESGKLIEFDETYTDKNKDAKVEELFGVSEEMLLERKEMFENFASRIPGKKGPVSSAKKPTGNAKDHFKALLR